MVFEPLAVAGIIFPNQAWSSPNVLVVQVIPERTRTAVLRSWCIVLLGLLASVLVLGHFAFAAAAAQDTDAMRHNHNK